MRAFLPIALSVLALAAPAQSQDALPPRWVTLGTSGGPAVQIERAQIANALVVGDAVYLFDAGNGVRRQLAKAGIPERNVKALFLSHHHPDHNSDTGSLIIQHYLMGRGVLQVIGAQGTETLVAGIVAANPPTVLASYPTFGPARARLAETVAAEDIAANLTNVQEIYADENVNVSAITVNHYELAPSVPMAGRPHAVAFRVEAKGRSYVFSGDTGPSKALETLARGADVLVTEVVDIAAINQQLAQAPGMPPPMRENLVEGMRVNHLPAEEIGKLAARAKVGRVVLTHFVPSPEAMADPLLMVAAIKQHYSGPVALAEDLDAF